MIKKLTILTAIVAVLGMALAVGVSYAGPGAGPGDIYGSDHDLSSQGTPTCQNCHVPHDAKGPYLWAKTPKPAATGYQLLTDAPTAPLCLSCHDGTVAPSAMWIVADSTVNHRMGPDGSGHFSNYGDGYCAGCHDAHNGAWRFTKAQMSPTKPPNPYGGQFCMACHGTRAPFNNPDINHPWATAEMTSPLPLDGTFDPGANDPEGTRLWDSATLMEPVAQSQPGNVTCLTCHAAHGAATDNATLNSMALIDENGREALCGNCHQ